MDIEKLKFPIGKFIAPQEIDSKARKSMIKDIEDLPKILKKVTKNLSKEQLDTPYRPDGWTVRQVVHHLADSHVNSYIRFRWTLTENEPEIKAYNEKLWAEVYDAKNEDIKLSLMLLTGLHARWTSLLKEMDEKTYKKQLIHPDYPRKLSLNLMTALYSWHCRHHTAHITELIKRKGW
jgi:hypothetical protein